VNARNEKELQTGFSTMATRHAGAVIVVDDTYINTQNGNIAGLALKYKLPTLFSYARGVEDGGLIGYVNDVRYRYPGRRELR